MPTHETSAASRNTEEQLVRCAVAENVVTLIVFAAVIIFAPGAWKWAGVACLLNLNDFKKRETPNAGDQVSSEAR